MNESRCDFDAALISAYLDGELDAATTRLVETHAAACASCRVLLADLQQLRHEAAALPPIAPPSRLRAQVLARLEHAAAEAARGQAGDGRRAWVWLAAAAALILAAAGVWMVRSPSPAADARVARLESRSGSPATATPGAESGPAMPPAIEVADTSRPTTADTATTVVEELKLAEEHYQKAIRGLQAITKKDQGALDPQVAATLRKNLSVIDQAITESRSAVAKDPASRPAQESLLDAFRTKLSLLQDTVALINEMRKGNPTGTARLIQNLKSS